MIQARFHDGRTAAAHTVDVAAADGTLSFAVAGEPFAWPIADLDVEELGDRARLARPGDAARLILSIEDWRTLAPSRGRRLRRRELRLIAGLTLAAAAVCAVVFIGVPIASGPLARATPTAYERRMGESFEAQIGLAFKPCAGAAGQQALQRLAGRLEQASDSPFELRARAVQAPMANAFALPGGAILVTDDLIEMAESPDELAAVLAHEAAHVERRHVMQAVWRSLGLGLILDAVVGGGTGAGQQAVLLAGSITDLRYSRKAELEADSRGQALLNRAGFSSAGMGPFFRRLAEAADGEGPKAAAVRELISTHPDTARRAALSDARARPGPPAFTSAEWAAIKAACPAEKPRRRLLPGFG